MPTSLGKRPRTEKTMQPPPASERSTACPHGKVKRGYLCKECPGKGICEHGRQRAQCKACGGSAFCEHGRQRSRCKACGGSGICEHGRQRAQCKACGGSAFCEHGRQRSRCKACGGSGICEHGRQRSGCTECRDARAASAQATRPAPPSEPDAEIAPEIVLEPATRRTRATFPR